MSITDWIAVIGSLLFLVAAATRAHRSHRRRAAEALWLIDTVPHVKRGSRALEYVPWLMESGYLLGTRRAERPIAIMVNRRLELLQHDAWKLTAAGHDYMMRHLKGLTP